MRSTTWSLIPHTGAIAWGLASHGGARRVDEWKAKDKILAWTLTLILFLSNAQGVQQKYLQSGDCDLCTFHLACPWFWQYCKQIKWETSSILPWGGRGRFARNKYFITCLRACAIFSHYIVNAMKFRIRFDNGNSQGPQKQSISQRLVLLNSKQVIIIFLQFLGLKVPVKKIKTCVVFTWVTGLMYYLLSFFWYALYVCIGYSYGSDRNICNRYYFCMIPLPLSLVHCISSVVWCHAESTLKQQTYVNRCSWCYAEAAWNNRKTPWAVTRCNRAEAARKI